MIQIYNPENTDFEKNGDMTLFPTSAIVHPILNGSWTAEMEHPIDSEGRWKYIQEEAVIKMPSFNGEQLFRIKSKEKSDSGVVCEMEPIFFDSIGDCFLEDIRPTGKNGQEALNLMTAPNTKYSGQSNITRTATAYYQFKNLMEAINGNEGNSFINRWGGEILFDNFKIIINERVGGDYGVELRYGKNISQDGLTEEIDTRSVVTRIYPKAYNGYTMTDHGYVDSELIGSYPTVRSKTIIFSDVKMESDVQENDEENGVTICYSQEDLDTALIQRCEEQYAAGLDKPKVTISADMVLLQDTDLYADYKILEEVSLGDTIHCRHSRLGITTDARVIELEYDSTRKKVTSVVLGDFRYNYFNNVSSAVNRVEKAIRPDGTIMAEKIAGFINGAMASLKAQYNIAKKQDVLAILFENLEEDNPMYGALAIGTQGILISKQRTTDGKSWEWTTALTAGGLVANIVVAGILSDKLGKNYWNLDTGEFHLTSASTIVDGQPLETIFGDNLLRDYIGMSPDYWGYSYTSVERGQTDPFSGTCAIKLTGMKKNVGSTTLEFEPNIRTLENNKPVRVGNKSYITSVWLKANMETTGKINFYSETRAIYLKTTWQRYDYTINVEEYNDTIQPQFRVKADKYQVDGTEVELYVYNPTVVYQDVTYSQEDVFNMLTNNGETQGVHMKDGRIYINATYIDTGILAGWTIDKANQKITSPDGTIILDALNNTITTKIGENGFKTTIGAGTISTGKGDFSRIDVESEATLGSNNASYVKIRSSFGDGGSQENSEINIEGKFYASNDTAELHKLSNASGVNLVIASDGKTISYSASSSKRYKDHVRDMTTEEARGLIETTPVWFQYKDGYLTETDELYGKEIPGFYAEDMAEHYKMGVRYKDGIPEDWREKMVIPAIVKLLQDHEERIRKSEGGNLN